METRSNQNPAHSAIQIQTIAGLIESCRMSSDFASEQADGSLFSVHYFKPIINKDILHRCIMPYLTQVKTLVSLGCSQLF